MYKRDQRVNLNVRVERGPVNMSHQPSTSRYNNQRSDIVTRGGGYYMDPPKETSEVRASSNNQDKQIEWIEGSDDTVECCRQAIRYKGLDTKVASSIINTEFRCLFISGIKSDDEKFDLDAIKCLDGLIFESTEYIFTKSIDSYVSFSNIYKKVNTNADCKLVHRLIDRTVELLDYKSANMKAAHDYIDHVFQVFQ